MKFCFNTHVYSFTNAMIFKRNLKDFIFCPQNYPERCSPRTVCYNLLHTVAIYSTVCNDLLQSEARMATLCNKKNCCYIASPFVLSSESRCNYFLSHQISRISNFCFFILFCCRQHFMIFDNYEYEMKIVLCDLLEVQREGRGGGVREFQNINKANQNPFPKF